MRISQVSIIYLHISILSHNSLDFIFGLVNCFQKISFFSTRFQSTPSSKSWSVSFFTHNCSPRDSVVLLILGAPQNHYHQSGTQWCMVMSRKRVLRGKMYITFFTDISVHLTPKNSMKAFPDQMKYLCSQKTPVHAFPFSFVLCSKHY